MVRHRLYTVGQRLIVVAGLNCFLTLQKHKACANIVLGKELSFYQQEHVRLDLFYTSRVTDCYMFFPELLIVTSADSFWPCVDEVSKLW